ncbi:MAG TPA: phosphoribosylformylglycinamidine synthase subunit PurS [Stellaceae bacterium]|nr:phosphoribosylformylglycinamidine synthase subunit PurS [Stellaceae bacterium]
MKARVLVTFKPSVLDPQGKAIGNALTSLGFAGIGDVRQGKLIEFDLAESDPARARERVDAMCRALLANPVTENYTIEIIPGGETASLRPGPP